MNMSAVEVTVQEGAYIDNRLSLVIPALDVNSLSAVFNVSGNQSEAVVYLDSAAAQVTLYHDLYLVQTKGKLHLPLLT
jgi:hypothetical protein